MWCFLCDRPAKGRVVVLITDVSRFATPPGDVVTKTLDVCEDCMRRVKKVEYSVRTNEHTVVLRSLT